MSVQDLELNCQIRSVIARHWIDPNRLAFQARRGHVHVSGEICATGAPKNLEETAWVLRSIEADVRRIREVCAVDFELTNWIRDENGSWNFKEKRATAPRETAAQGGAPPVVEAANVSSSTPSSGS